MTKSSNHGNRRKTITLIISALLFTLSMANFQSDIMEVTDMPEEHFLARPRVQASANIVYLDDKLVPNEYFGNLFVGSEVWRAKVCYDTMSDWTVVSDSYNIFSSENQNSVINEDGT